MVTRDTPDRFLIDARFILNRVVDAFLGARLLTANGVDTTFTFGFARDLLRMRQKLGLRAGTVVIAKEVADIANGNIDGIVRLLAQFQFSCVHDPASTALAVLGSLQDRFTHIVTADRCVLQLSRDGLVIVLADARRTNEYESYSTETVRAKLGVASINVPTYLALTTFSKKAGLTHRQAVRLVEQFGDLDAIYKNVGQIASAIRIALKANEEDPESVNAVGHKA